MQGRVTSQGRYARRVSPLLRSAMQPRTGRPDPRHRGGSAPACGAHGANQCTRSGVGARLGCRRRPEGGMQATRSMGCWSSMSSRALHCDRHATEFLGVDRADGANSDQPRCDHRVAALAASLRRPRRPATFRSRSNASARAAPSTHCTSARIQVVRAHGPGGASHGQDSKFGEGQDADGHSSGLLHNLHYAKFDPACSCRLVWTGQSSVDTQLPLCVRRQEIAPTTANKYPVVDRQLPAIRTGRDKSP